MSQTTESSITLAGVDDVTESVITTESMFSNKSDTNQQVWRPLQSDVLSLTNIDICGIDMSDNGRHCSRHCCCGHYVKEGDLLLLKTVTEHLIIDGIRDDYMRTMVKAYKINKKGILSCHIGYVTERTFWQVTQEAFDGKFVQVIMDYRKSSYEIDRHMSYKKHGLLRGRIIYDDDDLYGYDYTNNNPCNVTNYYTDITVDDEEDASHISDYISSIPIKKNKHAKKKPPTTNDNNKVTKPCKIINKQASKKNVKKKSEQNMNIEQPNKKQRNKTSKPNNTLLGNDGKFLIGTMVTIQNQDGCRHNGQVIKYTGYGTAYLISLCNHELIELTHSEMVKAVEAYGRPMSSIESVIIPMDYSTPADTMAEQHSAVSSVTNEERFY
jgi:hypothetical protein